MKAILNVSQLSIGYEKPLKEGIDFDVVRGDIFHLKGENGSGKSTLLKTILGQHRPLSGAYDWGCQQSEIGFLPQVANPWPHLSVTIGEIFELYDMGEELKKLIPNELVNRRWIDASGGEKQKTLILTKLSQGAKVLVLDEPFNHLDQEAIEEFQAFLFDLVQKETVWSMVLVSHIDPRDDKVSIKRYQL